MCMYMCYALHMPLPERKQKSTERMVVLLDPTERRRLKELAKAQNVSAAEILRRSLAAYEPEQAEGERQLLQELNAAIDRALAAGAEHEKRIDANLAKLQQLRLPEDVNARLDELYEEALSEQARRKQEPARAQRRTAA